MYSSLAIGIEKIQMYTSIQCYDENETFLHAKVVNVGLSTLVLRLSVAHNHDCDIMYLPM